MGHIQDRWYRAGGDRSELFGRGLRYKARYIDPSGRERAKSFPDRQKWRAERFLIEVESDKWEGKYVDPTAGRKPLRLVAENWLNGRSPDAATRGALQSRLNSQIYPLLGDRAIGSFKPSTVRDWQGNLERQGLSSGYKAILFRMLSSILDAAVDDRLIRENPCKARSVQAPAAERPRVTVWPEQRVRDIQTNLADRFAVIVPLGAGLGMRQGEILGVSTDDFDERRMVINLERQIRIVDQQLVYAPPKGGKPRTVPVPPRLLDRIRTHQQQFPPVAVTLPWKEPHGKPVTVQLLVTSPQGKPIHRSFANGAVWKRAFRNAGIDYRGRIDGMHALRHFYASTLLERGVSVKEVAEFLGHADPGFTLRVYTHLVPSSHERARRAIDGLLCEMV